MSRLTDRGVIHFEVASDGAHDNLSRVKADANLYRNTLGPSYSLSIMLYRLLHPERHIASPHRVIFMSQRRAEQSHDAVAHDLVDGAFITVDAVHHVLQ